MADSGSDLAQAVAKMFPGHGVEMKNSIGEKRRNLTITHEKGDEVVRVRLEAKAAEKGERTADAIFVCRAKDAQHFVVVIVELKGSDFPHALSQLEQTSERYCGRGRKKEHGKGVGSNHLKRVIGLVSCPRGQKDQAKIKEMRKRGIDALHWKDYRIDLSVLLKKAK